MEKHLEAGKTYRIKEPYPTNQGSDKISRIYRGEEFTVIKKVEDNKYKIKIGKKVFIKWLSPFNYEETIIGKINLILKD